MTLDRDSLSPPKLAESRVYITSPIYYVNGDPHIGHAHTSVSADVLKRIALMRGQAVFMTTGTDEHGQKNQEAAEASGLATDAYLERQSLRFRELFDRLNVSYDFFVRTTYPAHIAAVTELLQRLWDRGLLVKKMYRGLYCVGCEQFKRPSDLDELGRCKDHLILPVDSEELNYFLVLAPFQDWLVEYVNTHPDYIQPSFFRREILAMLSEPLDDLSISRPKSRVSLGIELPFDRDYVTYVWFDALINYISSIGWPSDTERFEMWWPGVEHIMAKDIIKTHCIYWPIMLRALEIAPPAVYHVHGYWVGEGGRKMSKSLGNAVDAQKLADHVGVDGLRYYLMKNMTSGDSTISTRLVVETYNADLANTLGNLFSRVLKFASETARVPSPSAMVAADVLLVEETAALARRIFDAATFENIPSLAKGLIEIATRLNAYVGEIAPWKLARDPEKRDRLDSAIYALMEGLRIVAQLAWPLMPTTSDRALQILGAATVGETLLASPHRFIPFGLVPGAGISELEAPLFPRVRATGA